MSNTVPDMPGEEDYPYCFWYPDIASEDTYRALAARYPALKYLVGRACAVAGYSTLFHELNLLPEVHIAEEAQDNGCMDILESIIAAARKYSTMDDYTRSLHDPIPATLNCDTSVRSQLTWRQKCREPSTYHDIGGLANEDIGQFNITEDFNVDDHDTRPPLAKCDVRSLLLQPLPIDLPPVRKDVLILSAAYDGNIDRYDRLRRPRMVRLEDTCVIRGIITAFHLLSGVKHSLIFFGTGTFDPPSVQGI
ncbi:Hypothetical protein D9617_1g083260 [Elsinoe fawcettii]|nr:Hypothetical protein D9617_1g083260 [Elsinoe fawcettii]